MNIGYARVSTEEQNLDLQIGALEAAGCDTIYEDRGISGAAAYRPGLADALARAGEGDVLVVWKLDRLGRSLPHLVEVINGLREAGVGLRPRIRAITSERLKPIAGIVTLIGFTAKSR